MQPTVDLDRFNDAAYRYFDRRVDDIPFGRECDCGCRAAITIHGQARCWDCAEEEGVKRIR